MPEHNTVLLDEKSMRDALTYLSVRLFERFRTTVRLVIHGGAVMVLHRELSRKRSTPDVDYIHRAFVAEWKARGVRDAGERLTLCIAETARAFNLGNDWMNSHADIALPMARDPYGNLTDPIYNDAVKPTNLHMNTVFQSPGLVLIGVSWSWAVALKLVRYRKDDPEDIAAILSLGTAMRGCQWTVQLLEGWLLNLCSPMGYSYYPPSEISKTRARMKDAIHRTTKLPWEASVSTVPQPSKPAPTLVPSWIAQQQPTARPAQTQQPARPLTVHEGEFEHQRKRKERQLASRSRTRSFSAITSSAPIVPSVPMPPLPRPVAAPVYPPNYVSRPPRSYHASAPVPAAAAPPPPMPLPQTTKTSHLPSRRPSVAPAPSPPHSASFAWAAPRPLPTQIAQSLPPGFMPTHWKPRSHRVMLVS